MPSAAARPSSREREIAMRETRTKLGPGLMAPMDKAAMMLRKTLREDIGSSKVLCEIARQMLRRVVATLAKTIHFNRQ
jgi:hypothetical protein